MKERVKIALQNYSKGYTCSQSIICAYKEYLGCSEELVYKLFEGFGGGIGGLQHVCGALSGAIAVLSFKYSDGSLLGTSKANTYVYVRNMCDLFKEKYNTIICKEILNGNKPKPFRCGEKVRIACEILEDMLNEM